MLSMRLIFENSSVCLGDLVFGGTGQSLLLI